MKTLLLLRHAKSSWDDPSLADFDRPLNGRGKRDAPRMGRLLREQGLEPDRVLCSTAKRARKTAYKVLQASGFAVDMNEDDRLYHAAPQAFVEVLQQQGDPLNCVLVVAHNPGLEEFLALLTGQYDRMPTAALAQIDLAIDRWSELSHDTRGTLHALWRPKELD